jgi:transposase InsO family protein
MNSHKNALLTAKGRASMVRAVVDEGLSVATVARLYRTTPKTVAKWVARLRAEGIDGLRDRSSRPLSSPSRTPPATCAAIEASRRQRHTGKQIAGEVGVSPATVSRVLRRLGLNSLKALEPAEPVRRYERAHPGEMIHLDIKKLGRFEQVGHRITGDRSNRRARGEGLGWEFVHVCIDDASRVAFSQILPDEKAASAVPFLKAAVAYYASLGVAVTRVMTDNGSCYKAFAFRNACCELGLRHVRTRPYSPKTNGKAERFIQTALREWAYAQAYPTSDRRAEELPAWLHRYNWHRPHAGIKSQTPISRLPISEDNVRRQRL